MRDWLSAAEHEWQSRKRLSKNVEQKAIHQRVHRRQNFLSKYGGALRKLEHYLYYTTHRVNRLPDVERCEFTVKRNEDGIPRFEVTSRRRIQLPVRDLLKLGRFVGVVSCEVKRTVHFAADRNYDGTLHMQAVVKKGEYLNDFVKPSRRRYQVTVNGEAELLREKQIDHVMPLTMLSERIVLDLFQWLCWKTNDIVLERI